MAPPGCRAVAAALVLSAGAASADPAFDQLTFHGNRQRTGLNSAESVLTPTAVSGSGFGRLWDSPAFDKVVVGGATYAPHMYASPSCSTFPSDRTSMAGEGGWSPSTPAAPLARRASPAAFPEGPLQTRRPTQECGERVVPPSDLPASSM